MRILVVEDDAAVRDAVRRALQLEGYEVDVAGERVAADRLVLAAGAWTAKVLGPALPLQPLRCVVAFFEPTGDGTASNGSTICREHAHHEVRAPR